MEHDHHSPGEDMKSECTCGSECVSCQAEKLCVTAGCAMEAKQYEYKSHEKHSMNHMNHVDHEAAMTNPQMAKEMEKDMKRRFFISLALSIPIFLYSPVGVNLFGLSLPSPIPANWLLLMSASSIIVATNAVLLKRVESKL